MTRWAGLPETSGARTTAAVRQPGRPFFICGRDTDFEQQRNEDTKDAGKSNRVSSASRSGIFGTLAGEGWGKTNFNPPGG